MPSKNDNKKLKVVVFLGKNLSGSDKINAAADELSDIKVINSSIKVIDFSDIVGKTDENTMFIICAHGGSKKDTSELDLYFDNFWDKDSDTPPPRVKIHHIMSDTISISDNFDTKDNFSSKDANTKRTYEFFAELQNQLRDHKISATLFSCHGGYALSNDDEINKGISLLVRSSGKYSTSGAHNVTAILKIFKWKIEDNLSNQEIYAKLLREDVETFYYRGSGVDDKVIKFSRPGKFDLKEIISFLDEIGFSQEQKDNIINHLSVKGVSGNLKTSFSIFSIEKLIQTPPKLADALINNFIKKLEDELKKKLVVDQVESFLLNRGVDTFGKENLSTTSKPFDIYQMLNLSIRRDNSDVVKAVAANNPNYIIENFEALLNFATNRESQKVIKVLKDFILENAKKEEKNPPLGLQNFIGKKIIDMHTALLRSLTNQTKEEKTSRNSPENVAASSLKHGTSTKEKV